MSPLEIWTFKFKDTFYIPSFTSSSLQRTKAEKFDGNVMLIVDTSEYNNFTTIIQPHQSKYAEDECLISCYNVFKWVSYSYNPGDKYVTVELKLVNYDVANSIQTHSIIGAEHGNVPIKYLKSGSEKLKNRHLTAQEFDTCYREFNTV